MTPGLRRVDLFSRESGQGFETWGKKRGKFDAIAPSAPPSVPQMAQSPAPFAIHIPICPTKAPQKRG